MFLAFMFAALSVLLPACERPSKTPPPEEALRVMQGIKTGYNSRDVEKLCADFGDIMFTQGFTKEAYGEIIDTLQQQLGKWESEAYLGVKDGVHTWRGKFEKGTAKVVIVLSSKGKVTGLWFR